MVLRSESRGFPIFKPLARVLLNAFASDGGADDCRAGILLVTEAQVIHHLFVFVAKLKSCGPKFWLIVARVF
jgi:hypothetical protein